MITHKFGKLMIQRDTISAIFITDTDFFVAFIQMQSSLQMEFLLLLTLLCFPVSHLFSLIFSFTYWFLKMNFIDKPLWTLRCIYRHSTKWASRQERGTDVVPYCLHFQWVGLNVLQIIARQDVSLPYCFTHVVYTVWMGLFPRELSNIRN